jgi:hypothetical protein
MADTLKAVERPAERVQETFEFRRTHYRVYDEDGFAKSFSIDPPENACLESVITYLFEKFQGEGGTGYDSKDLVILLGPRIVAVIRKGRDGEPVLTRFAD